MWGLWLTASPLGCRAQVRGDGGKALWQPAAPSWWPAGPSWWPAAPTQDSTGAELSSALGKSALMWVFHVLYSLQEGPPIWHRSSMGYWGCLHCHPSLPPHLISVLLSPCGIFCPNMFSQRYCQLHRLVQLWLGLSNVEPAQH